LEAENGRLYGAEMFMFTDNSTAESAFHNGTSSSATLFELVVRLRKIQLFHGVKIHLIHVSGKRMISQGTDGISRGNLLEGVMSGKDMLEFVPISQSVCDRSPRFLEWMKSWIGMNDIEPLSPYEWTTRGQGLGKELWKNTDGVLFPIKGEENTFIWSPAPCIADVAIEYLRMSIHRRPQNVHFFVCPKLMPYKWRRGLLKSCDFSFYVDPGCDHWPVEMFEAVLVGVYLPLLPCFPWTFRKSKSVLEVERTLRHVQKSKARSQGSVLREFLKFTRAVPTMSHGVVRRLLSEGRIR
jgi:hypothetical protein